MKMPRVRFTVRWLMVVVAVLAASIYAERLRRLSWAYRGKAEKYAKGAWIEDYPQVGRGHVARSGLQAAREDWERREKLFLHSKALKEKYERAARQPWLPVDAAPPEP